MGTLRGTGAEGVSNQAFAAGYSPLTSTATESCILGVRKQTCVCLYRCDGHVVDLKKRTKERSN